MTNGAQEASAPAVKPRSLKSRFLLAIVAIIVLDILAFMFIPPFPLNRPGEPVTGIGDLILANLEFPVPHVIYPEGAQGPTSILSFETTITATIFTTWVVMAVVLFLFIAATRSVRLIPSRVQNLVEFVYEGLENWAVSLGGVSARRHVPLFATFFLFILFSNWSGLLPFFGKIVELRAPTSDVNVTIGLALVAFFYFHYQGFRALGFRGYLGKFFVLSGFKEGPAAGAIGLFVGLIEFLLEFIKPVTLAMRLFGNIFGGEVALGVITALTIAIVPVAMLGLELLLNFIQALIFSTLMLMYTIIAMESHGEEHHEEDHAPGTASLEPSAAH